MSDLVLLFYILFSIGTILIGYKAYGRWINHITIYSFVWGTQIVLFEVRLINYANLTVETTTYIFGAWVIFIIASLTFRTFYPAIVPAGTGLKLKYNENAVAGLLVFLIFIGAAATYQHWTILIRAFGSVQKAIINGNIIYTMTRKGGFPGEWKYLDSASMAASFLGGYYIAAKGRFPLLGILPLLTEFAESLTSFGRGDFIVTTVLWGTGYFVALHRAKAKDPHALRRHLVVLTSIGLIFVVAVELIQIVRTSSKSSFTAEPSALSHTKGIGGLIGPSLYLYLSSDVAVLNVFLNYNFKGDIEHQTFGANTLAPEYRMLSKLGLTDYPPQYEKAYVVPVFTNTGTFLRELYDDWGLVGSLIVVYLIGALCSITYETFQRKGSIVSLAVLAHLYVIVFWSFDVMATRWGNWVSSFILATIAGAIADGWARRRPRSTAELPLVER